MSHIHSVLNILDIGRVNNYYLDNDIELNNSQWERKVAPRKLKNLEEKKIQVNNQN